MEAKTHAAVTIEQFTRQAVPFANLPGHSSSMDILAQLARPAADDVLLDVACGPGLVACYFAPLVAQVTGIDLTPEMIRQARQLQADKQLDNLSWQVGSASSLPFEDDTFSLVLTRYSLHHFQNPAGVMAEMTRVCRAAGRVLVADVSLPSNQVERYDEIEKLRDPSHVHTLSRDEFADVFAAAGLSNIEFAEYQVELALEDQLAASFPVEGGADRIRSTLRSDVGVDRYGVNAHFVGEALHYAIPIVIGVGTVGD